MGRHGYAGGILHHTRLDRVQLPLAGIEDGGGPAEGVEAVFGAVLGLVVAFAVRLPELQEGVTHQVAVAVEDRSEEHTSELQSRENLVCRLLLEKKKKQTQNN